VIKPLRSFEGLTENPGVKHIRGQKIGGVGGRNTQKSKILEEIAGVENVSYGKPNCCSGCFFEVGYDL